MSEISDAATRFKAMEQLLEKNDGQFGGAFVVVPPPGAGEPIETLILDAKQDPAQFWTLLKTKCDIALGELDAKQRAGQAFGRR